MTRSGGGHGSGTGGGSTGVLAVRGKIRGWGAGLGGREGQGAMVSGEGSDGAVGVTSGDGRLRSAPEPRASPED